MVSLNQAQKNSRIVASVQPNEAQVAVFGCSSRQNPSLYFELETNSWKFIQKRVINNIQPIKKCVESKEDLFDLCKRLYPTLDVTNIERVQQAVEFSAFFGQRSLYEKQFIQPFKCLSGRYESKSLYVPTDCQFKSLYANNDECKAQEEWQQQSAKSCLEMNMMLNVSALLQWCDSSKLGQFSGIEFVCCSNIDLNAIVEDEDIDDDGNDEYDDDEDDDANEIALNDANINDVKNDDFVAINGNRDEIAQHKSRISDIDAKYETKRLEITNKWQTQLKTANDEKLVNKEYNDKLVELENAKQGELFDAEVAYNEILQAKLNQAKYEKTIELQKELKGTQTEKVQKIFTELFTLYERDRLLQVSIYKRLKANFPDKLDKQAKNIVENIKLIDVINNKNKELMKKYKTDKKFEASVEKNVFALYKQSQDDALKILKDYETSANIPSESVLGVLADAAAVTTTTTAANDVKDDYSSEIDNDIDSGSEESPEIVPIVVTTTTTKTTTKLANSDYSNEYDDANSEIDGIDSDSENDEDSSSNEIQVIEDPLVDSIKQPNLIQSEDPNYKQNNKLKIVDNGDDDDDDDYDDDDDDEDDRNDAIIQKDLSKKIKTYLVSAFIVFGCAIVVTIVFGFAIRQRNLRYRKKNGFVKVDTYSPEEAHVNQMQINGYENPAYKYFEQNQA